MKKFKFRSNYDETKKAEFYFIAETKNGFLLQKNFDQPRNDEKYHEFLDLFEDHILTFYAAGLELIEVTKTGFELICARYIVYNESYDLNLCKYKVLSSGRLWYALQTDNDIKNTDKKRFELLNK